MESLTGKATIAKVFSKICIVLDNSTSSPHFAHFWLL